MKTILIFVCVNLFLSLVAYKVVYSVCLYCQRTTVSETRLNASVSPDVYITMRQAAK